jgi:hypothetical protein
MAFELPPRSQVGYLSPDIAGEGVKVIMSDGDQITYNPTPPKPVMPDWSGIKSIRHYFGRTDFRVWPAWLYHPTQEPRLVKNEYEAADLGVCFREATWEEKGKYGRDRVWDWKDECQWRPQPYPDTIKFDPTKLEQGKEYIRTPVPQHTQNRDMLQMILPEVTAAVVNALKQGGAVNPTGIDPKQWDEFLAFQAWKKTQEAIDVVAPPVDENQTMMFGDPSQQSALGSMAMTEEQERALWEVEANKKGIRIDKRWSLDTLKERVRAVD